MLGYRERLKARGELRLKVRTVAGSEWARLAEQTHETGMEAIHELQEKRCRSFRESSNTTTSSLRSRTFPCTVRCSTCLPRRCTLPNPSTRAHLLALVEFIGLWERFLTDNLPHEVVSRIGADEENLKPVIRRPKRELRAASSSPSRNSRYFWWVLMSENGAGLRRGAARRAQHCRSGSANRAGQDRS